MYYIFFYRKNVSTGEVLKNEPYCWSFVNKAFWANEVERLHKDKDIHLEAYGVTIEKQTG